MHDVLTLVASIAVIAVIIWMVQLVVDRRAKAMRRACEGAGFEFERYPQGIPDPGLASIPLFRLGTNRHMRNLWSGVHAGIVIRLFDYEFTTGAADNIRIEHRTVCAMRLPEDFSMPDFTARPERLRDPMLDTIGMSKIEFEDSPEFSRSHVVRGKDASGVRDLFTPEIRGHLDGENDICLASGGSFLIAHRLGSGLSPSQVTAFLHDAVAIYERFAAAAPELPIPCQAQNRKFASQTSGSVPGTVSEVSEPTPPLR